MCSSAPFRRRRSRPLTTEGREESETPRTAASSREEERERERERSCPPDKRRSAPHSGRRANCSSLRRLRRCRRPQALMRKRHTAAIKDDGRKVGQGRKDGVVDVQQDFGIGIVRACVRAWVRACVRACLESSVNSFTRRFTRSPLSSWPQVVSTRGRAGETASTVGGKEEQRGWGGRGGGGSQGCRGRTTRRK